MDFLRDLLRVSGTTLAELAAMMDTSLTTVSRWFQHDDIKTSTLSHICFLLGFSLNIRLFRPSDEPGPHKLDKMALRFDRGQLPFLCQAMACYSISIDDLARRLNLHNTTIQYMFKTNDVYLSRLFRIAKEFDLSIQIEMTAQSSHVSRQIEGNTFSAIILPEYIMHEISI